MGRLTPTRRPNLTSKLDDPGRARIVCAHPTRAERCARPSLKYVLTSERVAGRRRHQGEGFGPATWPALLDDETWNGVRSTFSSKAHSPNLTNVRRYLCCAEPDARRAHTCTKLVACRKALSTRWPWPSGSPLYGAMNAAPNYDAGTPLPPDELGAWDEDLADFEARLASEVVEASDNELSPKGEAGLSAQSSLLV